MQERLEHAIKQAAMQQQIDALETVAVAPLVPPNNQRNCVDSDSIDRKKASGAAVGGSLAIRATQAAAEAAIAMAEAEVAQQAAAKLTNRTRSGSSASKHIHNAQLSKGRGAERCASSDTAGDRCVMKSVESPSVSNRTSTTQQTSTTSFLGDCEDARMPLSTTLSTTKKKQPPKVEKEEKQCNICTVM